MSLFQLTKSQSVIGLDITSTTVKLVELEAKGDEYTVKAFAVEPLPEGTVFEREIKNVMALSESVKRCLKKARTKCKQAVVAVPDQAVVTKIIDAPAEVGEFDLENYVNDQAPNFIPYSIDEVALDFDIIGPDHRAPDRQLLQLVAAKLEQLEDRTGCIKAADLKPKVVDVESYAYEHLLPIAAQMTGFDLANEVVAFVDAGATTTQFNVLSKGRLIHSRSLSFGGKSLTEDIMRRYGMSFPEAGRAKRTGELPDDYQHSLLEPFTEQLSAEISRAIQIYLSNGDGPDVERILLAGGCSAIANIEQTVQSITGLDCQVINPFESMKFAKSVNKDRLLEDGASMVVSAGLAIRGLM
ncbi:MAG: type IV pilus assembly protein PilM [Gammaproteobacteria bacterium]|nr:type IV pilus assembly protein PilM [Gammaproteobacteria bacterium]